MKEKTFIVRYGEVALKGTNKPFFEKKLIERIRKLLNQFSGTRVYRFEGLIFVKVDSKYDEKIIINRIGKVFGVDIISPTMEIVHDSKEREYTPDELMTLVKEAAVEFINNLIKEKGIQTFKVKAKRANKQFPIQSPDMSRQIGGAILKGCPSLKVDVHNPDVLLHVDVRKNVSYIYNEKISGFGGLPLGTNGRGMTLLSGGIDSPVATFMMAKRGMMIEAVHFHSYPYTSERAQEKVEELAKLVAVYCGRFKLHVVNLLPAQEEIAQKCPEGEMTILVRRFMMRLGEKLAKRNDCGMLITGENLGQVASQTAESIIVTDQCVTMPVMRPLISFDKTDIIGISKDIGTYDISIQPYEDCCTVFLPKRPVTKPRLEKILKSESLIDIDSIENQLLSSTEELIIKPE
jgi:thiamine biosynthesis protein ThiI